MSNIKTIKDPNTEKTVNICDRCNRLETIKNRLSKYSEITHGWHEGECNFCNEVKKDIKNQLE